MTKLQLDQVIRIISRTPAAVGSLLGDLPEEWTLSSGDEGKWALFDVMGHLIHGEETDWIPRAEIILAQGENRTFDKYDRLAQFEKSKGKPLSDLLTEFAHLRSGNIEKLIRLQLTPEQLQLKGVHPALGEVTLEQLLATWTVHDLNHIRQIVVYMGKLYGDEVGPWKEYLLILN